MSFWVNVLSGYFLGDLRWDPFFGSQIRAAIGAFPEALGAIGGSAFGGAGRERTKATAGSSPGRRVVITIWWQGAGRSKIVKHPIKNT